MNILLVCNSVIPAKLYGGIERVVWDLGHELVQKGHKVRFLARSNSYCDFAEMLHINPNQDLISQIPEDTDIIHFNLPIENKPSKPYLITIHGNGSIGEEFDINSVFVSKNHAQRHGADAYVYNGLNWAEFGKPDFSRKKKYCHFLGNAAWKIKNVKGANKTCKVAGEKLAVIGGTRISTKMGLKINFSPNAKFHGMLDNKSKIDIIKSSKALVFPVLWHEPFGLAIIESMYLGCPVFGTPYGSLPELVTEEYGKLSNKINELAEAIKNVDSYNSVQISEYAAERFNSSVMAENYIKMYEKVLNGEQLYKSIPVTEKSVNNRFIFE
jgi:hypothetical protein